MYSSKWFMSIIALLVVDVRTRALQQASIQPHRCYSCSTNSTSAPCDQRVGWTILECPDKRPLCATTIVSPDYREYLSCASATENPCSLIHTAEQTYELTCICNGQLCNAPFSKKLQNELHNFSSSYMGEHNDSANITEMFFSMSKFANITSLYRSITDIIIAETETPVWKSSGMTTLTPAPVVKNTQTVLKQVENVIPHPEALKQEATVPSDDDEDESEGSGSYEEARHIPPASAPAAPSSFLPAENSASSLLSSIFTTLLLTCLVV